MAVSFREEEESDHEERKDKEEFKEAEGGLKKAVKRLNEVEILKQLRGYVSVVLCG